jgi:hypothetical protein
VAEWIYGDAGKDVLYVGILDCANGGSGINIINVSGKSKKGAK